LTGNCGGIEPANESCLPPVSSTVPVDNFVDKSIDTPLKASLIKPFNRLLNFCAEKNLYKTITYEKN
jgi:hypothetical protein